MQKVLTAAEMREVDRLTTEKFGIPSILLMENAANAAARVITEKIGGSVKGKSVLIICGKGNNGGDGAALARILWFQGADVTAILHGELDETKGDAQTNFKILRQLSEANGHGLGRLVFSVKDGDYGNRDSNSENEKYDVVVDALFGTGLTRPLDKAFELTPYLNGHENSILHVSLDIPSGFDADCNRPIGEHTTADITVAFTAPKLANVLPPASNHNGELHVADIGSPPQLIDDSPSQTYLAEKSDVIKWLRQTRFSDGSYKSQRGNAVLISGSKDYSGAAVLAGNAAMQTGIGMVSVATSASAQTAVAKRVIPEVITHGLAETENGAISEEAFDQIQQLARKADVLAIGSGLGSSEETTGKLVRAVVENRTTPIVIDADGLTALSPFDLQGTKELPLILTPHEGEFRRMLGIDETSEIDDRIFAVREFAQEHNVILVLKGERVLTGAPSGKVVINPTGNSGLGKAGNGDTLTGIITGFVAQGIRFEIGEFESVVAAVFLAGRAGDVAVGMRGKRTMLASDVRKSLTLAFGEMENG